MTPVPLTLPLRASEANEVANLVFDMAENRPLTDDIRNRIASRLVPLTLESIRPHMRSLARDPLHQSTYYVAVDTQDGPPQLLHMALAGAPTSSVFQKPLLIGRMRRPRGPEIVINAIPFGPEDAESLEKFVTRIDSAVLPRVQGSRSAIIAAPVAAAFEGFRGIFKGKGKNLAAIEMTAAEFDAGLWFALRAGWREGYSAGVTLDASECSRDVIRQAVRFTRYRVETTSLVDSVAADEDSSWILEEFARPVEIGSLLYELSAEEVQQAAVRFGPALKACERLHEWIREARSASKSSKGFDFEVALPAVSPKELIFCLHWLKTRERGAQFVSPGPVDPVAAESTLRELAAVARQYNCLLTLDSGPDPSDASLEAIARATTGRVNYRLTSRPSDETEYARYLSDVADLLGGWASARAGL